LYGHPPYEIGGREPRVQETRSSVRRQGLQPRGCVGCLPLSGASVGLLSPVPQDQRGTVSVSTVDVLVPSTLSCVGGAVRGPVSTWRRVGRCGLLPCRLAWTSTPESGGRHRPGAQDIHLGAKPLAQSMRRRRGRRKDIRPEVKSLTPEYGPFLALNLAPPFHTINGTAAPADGHDR
jgi:hypothetical protein